MIAEVWRGMRPGTRVVMAVLVLVVGLNLLTAGVTVVTGGSGPGGPPSSSYATADDGLAGYAELLARHGHDVVRIRERLDRADLDPAMTLVVADPDVLAPGEVQAIGAFVTAGGRLVVAGAAGAPALAAVPAGGPEWQDGRSGVAHPLAPVPEVEGIARVEAAGPGVWRRAGGALPVLGGPDGVLVTVATVGAGRIVALADTSPLQNRLLANADNAAFALGIAGDGRRVAFAEAQHGYGRSTGIGAVPARWRWALAGGFLAVIVWMWSRGQRLGPPDDVERTEPPARAAYVEAMAGALARTRQPEVAVAPVQERARHRLAERAGLAAGASEEGLRDVARRVGMPPEEVDALFRPCRSDAEVVAAGRALARLGRGRA